MSMPNGEQQHDPVSDLLDNLNYARSLFQEDQRAACTGALAAVIVFLKPVTDELRQSGAQVAPSILDPLTRLMVALESLDSGFVDPMLERATGKVREGGGGGVRPKIEHDHRKQHPRAAAAAAMEIFILARPGRPRRRAAAERVARLLAGSWLLAGDGAPWRQVAGWRDEVKKARRFLSLSELPPDATARDIAAAQYHELVVYARDKLRSGEWDAAALEAFATGKLRDGYGMGGGAPNSEVARAKSERDAP